MHTNRYIKYIHIEINKVLCLKPVPIFWGDSKFLHESVLISLSRKIPKAQRNMQSIYKKTTQHKFIFGSTRM